jgi:hypothetical protein
VGLIFSLSLSLSLSLFLYLFVFLSSPFLYFLLLNLHFIFSGLISSSACRESFFMLSCHALAYVLVKISLYYTVKYEPDGLECGRGSSCVFLLSSIRFNPFSF